MKQCRRHSIGCVFVWGSLVWSSFSPAFALLQTDLDQIFTTEPPSQSQWSVLVEEVKGDKPLYALSPEFTLVPASNLKLIVCAGMLLRLGPSYTYQTDLYGVGKQNGSTYQGDLLVVGSGDPSIGGRFNNGDLTELFRQWAAVLKKKNILTVIGDVVGVDSLFDNVRRGLNWNPDDYIEWYAAEVGAFSFNDGCVDLLIQGAAKSSLPAILSMNPPTRYVTLDNQVKTGIARRNGEYVRIEREPDSTRLTVYGAIPPRGGTARYATVPNPTLYFLTVLKETLQQEGIKIKGAPRGADDGKRLPDKKTWELWDTYNSPPLSQLVEVCLKNSQNHYAEHFLKTLGAVDYGVGSLETGALAVKDILFEHGCSIDDQYIADGSGLSRENRVSAHALVRVLRTMEQSPYGQVFKEALPRAGVDGTLEHRMRGTTAYSRVVAKTGTLNGVRALSGYIQADSGRTYIFSIIANGTRAAPRFTQIMDDACDIISSEG